MRLRTANRKRKRNASRDLLRTNLYNKAYRLINERVWEEYVKEYRAALRAELVGSPDSKPVGVINVKGANLLQG